MKEKYSGETEISIGLSVSKQYIFIIIVITKALVTIIKMCTSQIIANEHI